MTHAQKQTAKDFIIHILIGVSAFFIGSTITGMVFSKQLNAHEMIGGHSVMESRMNHVEGAIIEMKEEHDQDIRDINIKLDQILKEIRENKP